MTFSTQTVESGGKFWVRVIIQDHESLRRGPFPDARTAELMAEKLGGILRLLSPPRGIQYG
jgi:hypothetical protein